uniref:Uncharacterized protein n=1 Tax=Oryza meridionalis TaxID=40149 RepID=A0A0E0ELI7_9ORYZ
MAAAAAAEAAIRRGRLVSGAVSVAAALGALWLACALRIASAVNHCLAVKAVGVSVWADARCDATIELAAPAAVVLLILNAVAARREAKAEAEADAQIREAAGAAARNVVPDPGDLQQPLVTLALPAPTPSPRPERLRLRGSDAVLMFVVAFIYVCCAVLIVVGELLPVVGDLIPVDCQRQCQVQRRCLAWFFKNIGYLWLAVGHCCLIIPYAVLRLRRLARKKVASFFVSAPCMVHPQRLCITYFVLVILLFYVEILCSSQV